MNNKMKAALIGGVVLGVLSAIPFVNMLNACCCAWALIGGALATYMYVKSSPTPVSPADGAMLGAMAGGIGAVIYVILGVPLALLMGNTMQQAMSQIMSQANPEQAAAMQEAMAQGASVAGAIFGAIVGAIILAIFATIGGLIGVPIFEKRKGDAGMPPPPQSYGGGAYGS